MQDSFYDTERARRYDILRVRKNRCDSLYGYAMFLFFASVFVSAVRAWVLLNLAAGTGGNAVPVFGIWLVCTLSMLALEFLSVNRRDVRCAAAGAVLYVICCVLSRDMDYGAAVCLGLSLYTGWQWEKLKKEEGFPLFDIGSTEQNTHAAQLEQLTRRMREERDTQQEHTMQEMQAKISLQKQETPAAPHGEMEEL